MVHDVSVRIREPLYRAGMATRCRGCGLLSRRIRHFHAKGLSDPVMLIRMAWVAGSGSAPPGPFRHRICNEADRRVFLFGPGTRPGVSAPGTPGIWRCTTVGQKCAFVSWPISLLKLKHRISLPRYLGGLFEPLLRGPVPGSTTGLGAACTVGR